MVLSDEGEDINNWLKDLNLETDLLDKGSKYLHVK